MWMRASCDSVTYTLNSVDRPLNALDQDRLPALPQLGGVALARHVDQAGHEALERIAADEQPESLPVTELEYSGRDAQQVGLRGLEQLVARIGGEDVLQRFPRMAVGT